MHEVEEVGIRLRDLVISLPERLFGGRHDRMLEAHGIDGAHQAFLLQFCTPRLLDIAARFCRPDLLVAEDGLHAIEVNFSPAIGGLGLVDRVRREFAGSGYAAFLRRAGIRCDAPDMMAAWDNAVRRFVRRERPSQDLIVFIGLVDPVELAAPDSHFADFLAAVASFGFTVRVGLLQGLAVRPDGVFDDGVRIDIVYTMCTYAEMLSLRVPRGVMGGLAGADAAGVVDLIGSPANVLFDSKANLELLTAPGFQDRFSDGEKQFIQRCVPPTWRLDDRSLPQATEQREHLVLKPTSDFGGSKVTVGDGVAQADWVQALHAALRDDARYVLQRRVHNLWRWDDGDHTALPSAGYSVCLGPVILGDTYAGTVIRQAPNHGTTPVINVAQGGAAGAAFCTP